MRSDRDTVAVKLRHSVCDGLVSGERTKSRRLVTITVYEKGQNSECSSQLTLSMSTTVTVIGLCEHRRLTLSRYGLCAWHHLPPSATAFWITVGTRLNQPLPYAYA